jgi:hypothetical protein
VLTFHVRNGGLVFEPEFIEALDLLLLLSSLRGELGQTLLQQPPLLQVRGSLRTCGL